MAFEPETSMDYGKDVGRKSKLILCKVCDAKRKDGITFEDNVSKHQLNCDNCGIHLSNYYTFDEPENPIGGSILNIGSSRPEIFLCRTCSSEIGREFQDLAAFIGKHCFYGIVNGDICPPEPVNALFGITHHKK